MTALRVLIAAIALFTCLTGQSNADEASKERAVEWFRTVYAQAFISDAPDFYDRFYPDPVYFVREGSLEIIAARDFPGWVQNTYITDLVDKGWSQTKLAQATARSVDSGVVIVTARWAFTDADGAPITMNCETAGWHYVLAETDGAWRITTEIEARCPSP